MTNDILEYLEQLELTESEAKLYLTLLENGSMPVRTLAKAAGIYRTAAYLHIDRLVEKGLVMEVVKGSYTLVAATNPEESLKQLVENKIQSAKAVEAKFYQVIQKMNTIHPQIKPTEDAQIRYYKGKNAVKKIYEEALQANELRSYVKLSEAEEGKIFSENVTIFTEAFRRNPKLIIKEILYDSPLAKEKAPELLSKNKRYSYKFMPKDLELSSEDILMYNGKVAIINYTGKITSMVLHSRDYYNNSTELFDYLWKILP